MKTLEVTCVQWTLQPSTCSIGPPEVFRKPWVTGTVWRRSLPRKLLPSTRVSRPHAAIPISTSRTSLSLRFLPTGNTSDVFFAVRRRYWANQTEVWLNSGTLEAGDSIVEIEGQ